MTCEILILQPGIEPGPLAVKAGVLTTGPLVNSLRKYFNKHIYEVIPIMSADT